MATELNQQEEMGAFLAEVTQVFIFFFELRGGK